MTSTPEDDPDRVRPGQPPAPGPAAGPAPAPAAGPGAARRFHQPSTWLGVLLGLIAAPVALLLGTSVDLGRLTTVLLLASLVAPPLVGGVLAAVGGNPRRRGLGLGLVMGWGLLMVIGGGLCIALLSQYSGLS